MSRECQKKRPNLLCYFVVAHTHSLTDTNYSEPLLRDQ